MMLKKTAARVAVQAEPCQNIAANGGNPSGNTPWTPAHHAQVNQTKPVRLLELGEGPHGKCARFEFPEGWERTIDLPTQADGWHPLFNDLPHEDTMALRRHVLQPVVTGPGGKRKRHAPLSFTTDTVSARGAWIESSHFDVPDEDYGAGNITGYRCAGELLEALQRGYGPHIDVRAIIREASSIVFAGVFKPSRHGAAVGFMEVVSEAVKFLACHSRHSAFIASKIEAAERYQTFTRECEAKEKAAFVERMRQARAAKRAAREVNHGV